MPQSLQETIQNRIDYMQRQKEELIEAAQEQLEIAEAAERRRGVWLESVDRLSKEIAEHQAALNVIQ